MRWSGSTAAAAGLIPVIALLIANAVVSDWNTRRVVANEHWVAHTQTALASLAAVRADVTQAETSQRGYLITGGARYLDSYQAARERLESQLRELNALTADNLEQQRRVAVVESLVRARLERLQNNVLVRDQQGAAAAYRIVGTDAGEQIMAQLRAQIDAMQRTEEGLLAARVAESGRSLQVKTYTNVIGTVIGVAAVVLAFILFRRVLAEHDRAEARVKAQADYETALGELREYALSDADLDSLMDRTAGVVAERLQVPLTKILELLPDGTAFRLRAGIGWRPGCVGKALVSAAPDSQAGYTLRAGGPSVVGDLTTYQPVIVADLRREARFRGPALLQEHGVVSGISVIIHDRPERPFGVLGAHTTRLRAFSDDDVRLLQAIANVLAVAIQRRRAEASLRASEARFRALADSSPGVVWSSRPDGGCDYVNRRWTDWTGMAESESLGLGWATALHPDDLERSRRQWLGCMASGEPFECEYRFRMRDGSYRWTLGRALPVRDERGGIVKWFGNCVDIEDYKRLQAALIEADQHKDEFLAMLGHELRNPLAPMVNAVELLRRRATAENQQWPIGVIERQLGYLTRLVDDLLDASRIRRGKVSLALGRVDLNTVVSRAVELVRPLIEERNHVLEVALADVAPQLEADATRLIQVVGNLLRNAAKYTPRGGQIRVAVELHGDEAMIRVQDNGVGISAEMLAKVFELFVQAAAPSGGSPDGLGIGLALVKTLVAMHGGRVEAASAGPGRGSEFRVYLPILDAQPHSRQHEPLEPAADDATLHAWRILVVDDNALLAESFAELLASEGYMPRIAGSGAAALAAAREFRPEVIFLDIGLPDMNGYELARRLRREPHAQHALLVALSGYAPGSDSNPGDDTLFARYLLKPARIDEVKQLLRDWQRRKPTVAAGSAPAGVSHPAAPEGRRSEA